MKYHLFKKYKVKLDKDDFYKQLDVLTKSELEDIKKEQTTVSFYTNNVKNINNLTFENRYKKFISKRLVPHLLLIVSLFLICFVLFFSPYYIREIKYEKNSIEDKVIIDEVREYINENNVNYDLKSYQKELMIKYSHYSWIGLRKSGSVLYLSIELNFINPLPNEYNSIYGDLVSGYDAYIKSIVVRRGKSLVQTDQIVKTGEILVTGRIKEQNVSPNAEIIGEVIYLKTITIPKQKTIWSYNGNMLSYKNVQIGNLSFLDDKIPFDFYKKQINNLIKLSKLFEYNQINYYEIAEFVIKYDYENALNYAKSCIYCDLEKCRTSDLEKIINIDVMKITETDDDYIITLMITADKNIVVFKEY